MITHEVAITQIGRLFDNYNSSANQQSRECKINFLMQELKGFTNHDFTKICDLILKESKNKTFPVLEDFTSRWHRVKVDQEADFVNHTFCDKCGQTGYYTIWKLTGHDNCKQWFRFPYRCSCNSVTMSTLRVLDISCTPTTPHNPFPPNDTRHDTYNKRKRA